jgi:hypothetical protein
VKVVLSGLPYADPCVPGEAEDEPCETFWLGHDCCARVLVAHLLAHWQRYLCLKLERALEAARSVSAVCLQALAAFAQAVGGGGGHAFASVIGHAASAGTPGGVPRGQ